MSLAVAFGLAWEMEIAAQSSSGRSDVLPSSIRALYEELERESLGKLRTQASTVQPAVPAKAHRQGLTWYPHGQTMGTLANAVFGSTLHWSRYHLYDR